MKYGRARRKIFVYKGVLGHWVVTGLGGSSLDVERFATWEDAIAHAMVRARSRVG